MIISAGDFLSPNPAPWAVGDIKKVCKKLPASVVRKYELRKKIIVRHGPERLKVLPGFHDEKRMGKRSDMGKEVLQELKSAFTLNKDLPDLQDVNKIISELEKK